jgi:primosomal protein N' (replication factor Y)
MPGDFVRVPLGPRRLVGVVWDGPLGDARPVAAARLKPVLEHLADAPPLPAVLRRFITWVADYTLAAPGAVLRMAMSARAALEAAPTHLAYGLASSNEPEGLRLTDARRRVLALAGDGLPRPVGELARAAGVSPGVGRGLVRAGVLVARALPADQAPPCPNAAHPGPELSADQARAAHRLGELVAQNRFHVTLLDGVTGSGKTEVYFEAVAAALARNTAAQVLILVPEIALTDQGLARFEARFGAPPVVWHSEMTGAQRRRAWRAVAKGRARVVLGARSALFLPFADLRLIVVDEEHDPAFKQEDGVAYQARDMAVVRARLGDFPIILASATPSLESVANCRAGRYERLALPDRHGVAELPDITTIDMRAAKPPRGRWLSPPLEEALRQTLENGEQALLFLNRRGYAPLTLCRACGHRFACPHCTAWLVEHRYERALQCHHCGYRAAMPAACPQCSAKDALTACGPGVERLAEEVAGLFPEARLMTLTSDTLTGPSKAREMFRQVSAHETDIVIGTQVVAKGHHFPMLTLVGVIDADLGLSGGDLRAGERTFQMLSQVAGRAGRESRPGRVLLQTWEPDHPVMAALLSGDHRRFVETELAARQRHGMPPYGRLAALIVSGIDEAAVIATARQLGRLAPRLPGVAVFGPAPAPFTRLRGRRRQRLLVKAERAVNVQKLLRGWLRKMRPLGGVRIFVDIDPYSFL